MATLPEDDRSTTYTLGTSTAGPFLVGFPLFADDELRVSVNGVATSAYSVTSDYSGGFDANATITFNSALAVSDVVLIEGLITLSRDADLINGSPNLVSTLNTELTRTVAAGQETRRDASAALTAALAAQAVSEDLEDAVASATASASSAAASASSAAADAALLGEWRGPWVTATAYALGDRAQSGGSTYICVEAHTSAGAFATDFSGGKWELYASKGDSGAGTGDLVSTNNLSDITDAAVARTNLGLGTAAVLSAGVLGQFRGVVSSATDLNDLDETGWYYLATNSITNGPSGESIFVFGLLNVTTTVNGGDTVCHQVIYLYGGTSYFRVGALHVPLWTAWQRPLRSADIDTGSNFALSGTSITDRATIKTFVEAQKKLTPATAQTATGAETHFDFSGIPAGVNEIDVNFAGLSLSGADHVLVQLGDSGGVETTGYISASQYSTTRVPATNGFVINTGGASVALRGTMTLRRFESGAHLWISSHDIDRGQAAAYSPTSGGGDKTLSAELDRIRINRTGSNTFDAGSVNIAYR